ncbi:MAG: ABC transporter ATP-binding protein, partial [Bacilli bacterium]|nr:ABC transporter ATP-binding protein [Bacilli bacterium]
IFSFIQGAIIGAASGKIGLDLRKRVSVKINRLPLNYFDTRNIGDVLSFTTNDIDTIITALNNTLSTLISSLVTLLGIVTILFLLDWVIALIALISLPIALFLISFVSKRGEKHFKANQDSLGAVNAIAEENFTAYNLIRVFRAKEQGVGKFTKANDALRRASEKSEFYSSLMDPIMKFVSNVSFAVICLIAGLAVDLIAKAKGASIVSDMVPVIVASLMYTQQLVQPLSQFASVISQFQLTLAASDRVFGFLDGQEEIDESEKTDVIEEIKGNIDFAHVRFGYTKERVIVKDFSESGRSGQKIAIVGPTGAGKTTMVNLLMRFYDIDDGAICIDGKNTKELNRHYVRSLFGMVLQDTWLFQGTFMENLKFSRREASDEEVYAACQATHCDAFIRQQPGGYDGLVSEGLSSGQKQLLTIARAMVQNAPMLILDEATSSVDTRTELLIQDAMDKLMKGRTSFVIAHRLSTIKNSDLILVMRDGDVIESGNHKQLMEKKGFYSELYNAQFSGKGPQID